MTRTAVMFDARFAAHEMPPGHPERPERIGCLNELVDGLPESAYRRVEPRLAVREEVSLAHGPDHWDTIAATAHAPLTVLDPDTFAGPHSFETARLATGGTLALLDTIVRGDAENGFALVRPPGHHAERERAMGFCLFNHVAIGAAALRARGFGRVAIVDWDVH
ncbi:MAG: histone deacetylase, partial [Gemmatimonadetes bacterium]|nr:histone deacetylase [Gemmatimonadota bacterium]